MDFARLDNVEVKVEVEPRPFIGSKKYASLISQDTEFVDVSQGGAECSVQCVVCSVQCAE